MRADGADDFAVDADAGDTLTRADNRRAEAVSMGNAAGDRSRPYGLPVSGGAQCKSGDTELTQGAPRTLAPRRELPGTLLDGTIQKSGLRRQQFRDIPELAQFGDYCAGWK